MEFDPYHKWLGIPAAEQPANHYRLLAIAPFEDDPDVIETAADQRMALLRTFQSGQHSADSQRLLNELSAVRLCLLTPGKKAEYDAELRRRIDAAHSPKPKLPTARPLPPAPVRPLAPAPVAPEPPALIVTQAGAARHVTRKRRPGIGRTASAWLALAAVALPALAFIGYLISIKRETERKAPPRAAPDRQASIERNTSEPKRATEEPAKPTVPSSGDGQRAAPRSTPDVARVEAASEGFVSLFNGKDLTGWKTHPSLQGLWRVENGILIGSGPATSNLFSERGNFTNFHLRVEARINDGGNSGVFCRSTFGPALFPDGYEAQINSTGADKNKTGSLYGSGAAVVSIVNSIVRPNEWCTLELIAADHHFLVKVNGQTTADYYDSARSFPMGHLALQQHDPHTAAEFRKIEIKENPRPDLVAANGPPAETVASSVSASNEGPVNLLKLIDPKRDAVAGKWEHVGEKLITAAVPYSRLEIPFEVPTDYKLTAVAHCNHHGEALHLGLVVGRRQALVILDGWGKSVSCLALIDGRVKADNGSLRRGHCLRDGEPNFITCEVRANRIAVECNGTSVIDWTGDFDRLSLDPNWKIASSKHLLIGSYDTNFAITKLELSPLDKQEAGVAARASVLPLATSPTTPTEPAKAPGPTAKPRGLDDLAKQPAADAKLTAAEAFPLKQHTATVMRVAFHRTKPLLASAAGDGQVLLWNLETKAVALGMHKFREEVRAIKFSPDGGLLAMANRNWWGSKLFLKSLAGVQFAKPVAFKNPGGEVMAIAYSHDGRLFAAGQVDGTIRLWDAGQFLEIAPVGLGGGHDVYALAFGPVANDRKQKRIGYLLAAAGKDGVVRTIEASLGKTKNAQWAVRQTSVQFPKHPNAGSVLSVRFSPDGKLLGFTRRSGHVCLCDPLTGQGVRDLAGGSRGGGSVEWIAFHRERPWCVTAHKNDQAARIWNTETAELLCELRGHTGGVMCAEFSPDGRHVATASEDFSIKLWNLSGADVPAASKRGKKAKLVPLLVGD